MLTVRPATPEDVAYIWRMVNGMAEFERLSHLVDGSAKDLMQDLFSVASGPIAFIAEVGAQTVGYALLYRTYSTFRTRAGWWLEDLYIDEPYRGAGHGKALLTWLVEWARADGAGRLEWSVLDWNERAINLYTGMGAEVLPDWRVCRITF